MMIKHEDAVDRAANPSVVKVTARGANQVFREEISIKVSGHMDLAYFGAYAHREIFTRLRIIDPEAVISPKATKNGVYSISVTKDGYTQIEIRSYDDCGRGLRLEVWGKTFVKPVRRALADFIISLKGMSERDLLIALNAEARMPRPTFYLLRDR